MSEETERAESAPDGAGADPVAVALALGGASQAQADAFLKKQEAFISLQMKELAHELELRYWSMWVRHLSNVLKLTLEISAALQALALVCGAGVMVWSAAHANGLVVESFKVPPDLAEKGLSGDVVATQLLDRLSALRAQSNDIQMQNSFTNSWSDDLKVEIPETGVSLGEFNRYLRRWLGHETHVSGEVVRLDGGKREVTARVNGEAGQSFDGSEADFHASLVKAAEAIFANAQPITYAMALNRQGRFAEAEAIFRANTMKGSASERAWAYTMLAAPLMSRNQTTEAIRADRTAVALNPGFAYGWYNRAYTLSRADFLQASLDAAKKSVSLQPNASDLSPVAVQQGLAAAKGIVADDLGDFDQQIAQSAALYPMIDFSADPASQIHQAESASGGGVATPINHQQFLALARIGQHDLRAARQVLAGEPSYIAALKTEPIAVRLGQSYLDRVSERYRNVELSLAVETGSWSQVRQMALAMQAEVARAQAEHAGSAFDLRGEVWPDLALAEAQMGDFTAAHAQIDQTAADCDLCLRTRAKIDELQKNPGGADFWFARAQSLAPSIPFADQDWGQALLTRGQPDQAIEKFKRASQDSPHFADPLEGWGEALMAQNQSHLALAKFAEAEKYAPNWGRLHLKWGEALVYAGKKDEAKAQFARATQLDLTPGEKSELAGMRHV